MERKELVERLMVRPGRTISLAHDYDPGWTNDYAHKSDAKPILRAGLKRLAEYQDKLWAQDQWALLIVLQAMDAAGKDGLIKHVMSGLNPQGTQVFSFKEPSSEELDHDYLWRQSKALPERGRIGIFNRSHYEEVLIARVHPEILAGEHLPPACSGPDIWKQRYAQINAFEKYLVENGIIVLKLFLHVSLAEQKERFLERIERPDKNWKFSADDVKERSFWPAYMDAYESVLNHTSTEWAPWYVLPADHKWFTRLAAAEVIAETLGRLNLAYPELNPAQKQGLEEARRILASEG